MLEELKRLFKHSSIYGLGNVLGKMVGFFMIPVYTHYLTTADYGVLELLDLSLALMGLVLTMWMNASIVRHYYDYDDPQDRNEVVSTIYLLAVAIGAAVALAGVYLSCPPDSEDLGPALLRQPDRALIFRDLYHRRLLQLFASQAEACIHRRRGNGEPGDDAFDEHLFHRFPSHGCDWGAVQQLARQLAHRLCDECVHVTGSEHS